MTREEAREQLQVIMDDFCNGCDAEECEECQHLKAINMAAEALKDKEASEKEIQIPIPLKWDMNSLEGCDRLAKCVALKQNQIIDCITKTLLYVKDLPCLKGCEK